MKIFLGILSVLVVLAIGVLGILAIWGIYPVPWEIGWKSGVTLLAALILLAVLALLITLFFKKEKYSKEGNKAHMMNE